MTEDTMNLRGLLEKTADSDFLREMIGFSAQRLIAAVMDAVDAGYRVILAEDALCSVSDESHDAILRQFGARFSQQIEVAPVEEILDRGGAR